MKHPVPDEALDRRLGVTGMTSSGKTYGSGTLVERLLSTGARVMIFDPLDAWWGLRLKPDGKGRSPFKVLVFGGSHADMPIAAHQGALFGEAAATMAESAIISLTDLESDAAERRFMLAFLTALYRNAPKEPLHLIFDEADMWAPQRIFDKEGDATKLLGRMQTVVRRGRIKGFIPWLITQRPAEVHKGVLSMMDGLIAFRVTSPQDRAAIDAWASLRAEPGQILGQLPALPDGTALVWLPQQGICAVQPFPAKLTYDSSRTPKRGETIARLELPPLDMGALKEKLAAVEEERKRNDPKLLKAEVARLTAELGRIRQNTAGSAKIDAEALKDAEARGYARGAQVGGRSGVVMGAETALAEVRRRIGGIRVEDLTADITPQAAETPVEASRPAAAVTQRAAPAPALAPQPARRQAANGEEAPFLTPAKLRILRALRWTEDLTGRPGAVTERTALAFHVGMTAGTGGFNNYLGALRSGALIAYAGGGVQLTDEGRAQAGEPVRPTNEAVQSACLSKVSNRHGQILRLLIDAWPATITKDELAARIGMTAGTGAFNNYLGRLRSLQMIDYPEPGTARATDFLFPETTHG